MTDEVSKTLSVTLIDTVARMAHLNEQYETTKKNEFMIQEAMVFNAIKACAVSLDLGHYWLFRDQLGVPQSHREVYTILAQRADLPSDIVASLQRWVDFRSVALQVDVYTAFSLLTRLLATDLFAFEQFAHISQNTHNLINE